MKMVKEPRSNKLTTGLCDSIVGSDKRFCFFEIDFEHIEYLDCVREHYRHFGIDYIYHRTGNGYHFISPTLVSKAFWKKFHKPLRHINSKCSMTCLRWKPNKYDSEEIVWFLHEYETFGNDFRNSKELSQLLNDLFNTNFEGELVTDLKFVEYRLPFVTEGIHI